MTTLIQDAKKYILEIQVNAAPTEHDLGLYEPVEPFSGGYEVVMKPVAATVTKPPGL
jgi:hypothetical protein